MRVILHTDEYYPTAQACSYRMQVISDAFRKSGADVTVICSSANQDNDYHPERPEKIIYSPSIRMRKKTTVMRLLNNLSFGLSSVFYSVKAGKADVVITTSPPLLSSIPGWMIAKLKRATLVYDVRDIWPDIAIEMGSFSESSLYSQVFRKIARFMYAHADVITTVSPGKVKKIQKYVRDGASRRDSGRVQKRNMNKAHGSEDKVWLVGNGFDTGIEEYPINQSLVQEYDLENKFTCVYVGNIGLAQGLDALLKIAAETKHKEVQFLIFGKGAEKELLEQLAQEQGLHSIRFCGVLPHEDVHTLLKYADLSFIPLKNSFMKDSIPTKLYEALGIGCPVLLLAEGDSCDVLDETGLGRHVSPENIEQAVKAFDEIVDDYDTIAQFREKSQNIIHNKYTRQQIAGDFAHSILNAINNTTRKLQSGRG